MKKLRPPCLLLTCLLGSLGARAQTGAAPAVLGAAGQAFRAHGLTLDWTVGEVAVATWQPAGGAPHLLEGFHRRPAAPAEPVMADAPAVYPNPFNKELWVQVPPEAAAVQLELYDLLGRPVRTQLLLAEQGRVRLDVADLPVAGYVLRLYDEAQRKRTTFFLLKND